MPKSPTYLYKQPGSRNYHLRISINGQQYRETLRTSHLRTAEKRAKQRIEELRGQSEAGELDWRFVTGVISFQDELESETSSLGAETRKRYLVSLRQISRVIAAYYEELGRDIYDVMAGEITTAVIAEFVRLRRDEGVTIATINRDLTAFGSLMTHLKNKKWIDENPVKAYEKVGLRENLPDIVLPEYSAIQRLADRASGTLKYFPLFMDACGCRVTEAAMVRWSDIKGLDKEEGAKLTFRRTKGGIARTILLRPEAIKILRQIPRSNRSPYVFWNDSEHGHYKDISNLFWQFGQEVDFGSRLYDIRHKFAVERLQEGWSVYRVSRYLGHRSVKTTERYYFRYLTQEEQARALADGDNGF